MAWNEPGGNQKDPWGGGDQGPPDLDEAFKKLQDKLNGLFGGKTGGSGGGLGGGALIGVLILVLIVWGLLGVYQIDEQERGVVLRFGKYEETVSPGLHWNPPLIDDVTKVNVTRLRAYTVRNAAMLTEDQNIVEVTLSVQYDVQDPKDFLLKVANPEDSLAHATESALRHAVGGSEMHPILTEGREQLGVEVIQRLQEYLSIYQTGIRVVKVNINDTRPPSAVQAAFDDVIKAKEDEERAKNEAEAYRNGVIPEARGYAARLLEEANAYKQQVIAEAEGDASRFTAIRTEYERAPEVTRNRMYLDTLQNIMANTGKVVVDVDGGNNMMYLPLDKIIEKQNRPAPDAQYSTSQVRQAAETASQSARREASRVREGR